MALPGRWRLDRPLGEGGQSEVWLAYDLELDRLVAIKVFDPDLSPVARERLRREVRLGQTLRHPNLVPVHELIEAGERLAFAMEWMPGGSLAEALAGGPLPIEGVVKVADEALLALAYLHEQHVVHRDVKPSNLLLDGEGRVHLGDLGLVRSLGKGETLTRTLATVGTPAFMSPEQIHNQPVTPAADLYCLGATLYQLLTAELPFVGDSEFDVAVQHIVTPAPDPRRVRPECPSWLAAFVRRLLEKAPRDRWPDAGAARRALLRRRSGVSSRVRRRALAGAAAVVGAAALLVWGARAALRRAEAMASGPVQTEGSVVRGLDGRGRVAWSYNLAAPVRQLERADLDGDGRSETVVAAFPAQRMREPGEAESEVLIVGQDGKLISRIRPEGLVRTWPYAFRKLLDPFIKVLDLTGDGRREVVLLCHGRDSFPTVVLVFWPRSGLWEQALVHSGYVMDLVPAPGGPTPRLRILAFNNRMGMVHAVGEFSVPVPAAGGGLPFFEPLVSPDLSGITAGEPAGWDWYTLTDQVTTGRSIHGLTLAGDGSTRFEIGTSTVRIDRWGNPDPGPNAGRDLTALRGWFLDQMARMANPNPVLGKAEIEAWRAEVGARAAPLLAEPPNRVVFALRTATALSRLGDLAGAVAVLRTSDGTPPYEIVSYELALLDAFRGELDAARTLAVRTARQGLTPAGSSRSPHLLVALAVERRDATEFARLAERYANPAGQAPGVGEGTTAALWARAHLWWDAVEEADQRVHSWPFAPEGEAVACLARWRAGKTASSDVAAMAAFARDNPDVSYAGEVARAAALLALGRADDALAGLERAIPTLEGEVNDPDAVDPYLTHQFLDLARAMRVKALAAAGRAAEAERFARTLRPSLRAGLLPADLVAEAMRRAGAR